MNPAGQLRQVVRLGMPWVPSGQAVKPEGSVALMNDPWGTTTEAEPPVATISPAGTASHTVWPGVFWYKPGAQFIHLDDLEFPSSPEYLPGEQSLHSALLATPLADEYFPAGQLLQELSTLLPFSLPYLPAPHGIQLVALMAAFA